MVVPGWIVTFWIVIWYVGELRTQSKMQGTVATRIADRNARRRVVLRRVLLRTVKGVPF